MQSDIAQPRECLKHTKTLGPDGPRAFGVFQTFPQLIYVRLHCPHSQFQTLNQIQYQISHVDHHKLMALYQYIMQDDKKF